MPSSSAVDSDLIAALHKLAKTAPRLVRSSIYPAPADPRISVQSWKMNEFKYYDVPSPFPTLARGLFTRWDDDDVGNATGEEGSKGRYSIVARGYDKFFNIGEVPWTTWNALETHTTPPYVLTLKSNGCIIFIAPLTPSKLLITSKHSIGPVIGHEQSHAEVGEQWLRKHLESVGKTEADLAQTLSNNNWTAVAELCDDSFEEHVLPYSKELTGLHLHGLNSTTGTFQTRDPEDVETFARQWGFIPTAYTTLDTIAHVREFTQNIGKTENWNGQPIEGFVVRTHISDTSSAPGVPPEVLNVPGVTGGGRGGSHTCQDRDAPPYPPRSSFFFKIKFDEPYMMYRDWREVTKSLLAAKPGREPRISRAKLNRPETRVYKSWVEAEIMRDRKAFDGYMNNRGIVATRERFLKWCEEKEGKSKLAKELGKKPGMAEKTTDAKEVEFRKTIIVPVAIPGCGKTSIAVALKHLFGFGHTQSDDVKQKKSAPVFVKNVTELLKTHDVVIADRNNHLGEHRQNLRNAVASIQPPVRLIALNWSLDQPPAMIHRICSDRVQARGDNHQSLCPDERKSHENVIWMFIEKTQSLVENEVDEVIDMDLAEDLDEGLSRAVDGLVRILGVARPGDEEMGAALGVARTYVPEASKKDAGEQSEKAAKAKGREREKEKEKEELRKQPRYFGLLPELDLDAIVGGRLGEADVPLEAKQLWDMLKEKSHVSRRPHITLVHSKSLPGEQALWDRCTALHCMATPPSFVFKLGHVVCNERLMAITVDALGMERADGEQADLEAGAAFVEGLPQEVRGRLHITVGTRDASVNPFEAKSLVEEWRNGGKATVMALKDVEGRGRVKGLMS